MRLTFNLRGLLVAVHAVGVLCVRKELVRIINETQIIMSAAEEGRADVINRALMRIEAITSHMRLNGNTKG